MLVGERRNGNLLVQLDPKLQAQPVELLRQRLSPDGLTEYLIRWALQNVEEAAGNSGAASQTESKSTNILMWMSAEEVYTNCPTLLGKRKSEGPGVAEEKTSGSPDEGALQEMTEDVRMLVQRATRQMSQSSGPDSSILNTIHVLSAYASIGSLAGVFKETGALDLLMKMLCNPEKQIRKNAGKMLRALASHDAGSRAHVLLSLSQQDGIEQHMDFESRYTLLQLFAETTSSEEHCISFEGIHLPQIPGKQLFSLVKRYLCVTSLLDQLSSDRPDRTETFRLQRHFDFSMAMGSLICELVRVMGWVNDESSEKDGSPDREQPSRVIRSIFQPKVPPCTSFQVISSSPKRAIAPKRKPAKPFLEPSDFATRNAYVDYVQEYLKPGMTVRMLEDYDEISSGDEGSFRQSNNGMPPVQVLWRSTGRTYWVHWHMVQIIGEQAEDDSAEKASTVAENVKVSPVAQALPSKPCGSMYALPYLGPISFEERGILRQDEWWEVLFFIRRLEVPEQNEVHAMIKQNLEEPCGTDEAAFVQASISVDLTQKILGFLSKHCRGCVLSDLQSSHVYLKYVLRPSVAAAKLTSSSGSSAQDNSVPGVALSKKTKSEEPKKSDKAAAGTSGAEPSDLQVLRRLLSQEGVQVSSPSEDKSKDSLLGIGSFWGSSPKVCLELLAEMLDKVKRSICGAAALGFIVQIMEQQLSEEAHGVKSEGRTSCRDKIVKLLVELLTSQVKDKLLVVTCLQLTYLVMSKYDWRVLFATEGGVRAVLGCMQEHQSSAAVQHIGLAVLRVLTGVDACDIQGPSKRNTLNPGDAQVIKEIFSSIGSAASGTSTSLLRAIPSAIAKMISVEGCFSSVFNGFQVIRMLMENHKGLSEQLSSLELSSVLQTFSADSSNSMDGRLDVLMQKQLSDLLKNNKENVNADNKESAPALAVQEMDHSSLLSGLKDIRMCREMLPSLERCVCDDVSSLRCDVPQLLTDPNFFLQLLSCLEQLRGEKHLQLCVYRILNKALHLYEEDALPWHKSISPSLRILGASGGDREVRLDGADRMLFQEVVRFLHSLAAVSKDCAMVMCGLRAGDILNKTLDKQNSDEWTSKLRDLLKACEMYTDVHHKMAACVVAGCMQTVLAQIDEHRLRYQKLTVPLLDVFLRSLAGAYTKKEQKEDKCWEKMEVSSNPHRANKLTDGNPKSYWESSGSTGSHYINIYMHRGVVIRQLVMVVASEDSSYMPGRVVVMGGENSSNINTELIVVNIASTAGRVLLLENVTRFWPIIQIKIKRCQQGGIDTRVRGVEILGPKPTFWPVFKEQLCRRTFLLYTSRAHSWGQEICDKKENLLQLFSRLNRALSHEQEFADRFLPDDEAAQALGRTCWESLISPLVQSITTSDPGRVSPFGWLLTRYLENSQGSRQPKSPLSVFNSRVRTLTHLLVHMDTSPPDTSVLKPPSKTNEKNCSSASVPASASSCGMGSMARMAQCWQGVVQQQVQRFLEMSWNDVDLVPRFCCMYMALRRAMEEIFGQQTRFLLALQQGFCQGLLQLSFLTALHVTEQFARYIDKRIIAIRSDSSDVQSLKQLQQFLQCVLFLSDLELANSFEHFYRHYLADRLLTLGPCWLENSVVDHIGICFPNRFPQQMLKNLQEAKDLQREEHLYRLHQLDNAIISEDEEEGMVNLENESGKEDNVDVEVCVLSSQCWPFSTRCFMDDPQKYFSRALARHLLSVTNFFRKCPSLPGSSYIGQSQRLQWTWLGNAELQYGVLTLRVSTLQMFILLQFNQQEKISEEEIANLTGVSDGLLRTSLEPLTAKGGIVAIHEDTGCLCLDTSALCDRAGTVLTLSPTRVDGIPDISSVEEKRQLILELVDQVMKEERSIHIDALVAKVISDFQKQNDTPPFPLLTCSATDVLSCVMCQLREGAIYRKTDSPLILGCKEESPPSPPPIIPLLSHSEPVTPIPPQVSEFCSVRKITNNIGTEPEERPMFRTFRYLE